MPNFVSIINSYNKKILDENVAKSTSGSWISRVKAPCPLDGNCLQSGLVSICKAATAKITNFAKEKKHANAKVSVEWKILDKAKSYKPGSSKVHVMSDLEIPHPLLTG